MGGILIATEVGLPVSKSELTSELHLWACAHTVVRQHGEQAHTFIAERVEDLERAGALEGVQMWMEIASRLDQLLFKNGRLQ